MHGSDGLNVVNGDLNVTTRDLLMQDLAEINAVGSGFLRVGNSAGRVEFGGNGSDSIIRPVSNTLRLTTTRDIDNIEFYTNSTLSMVMRAATQNVEIPSGNLTVAGNASVNGGKLNVESDDGSRGEVNLGDGLTLKKQGDTIVLTDSG